MTVMLITIYDRSPTESQTAIAKLSLSIKARERIQVTGQAKRYSLVIRYITFPGYVKASINR